MWGRLGVVAWALLCAAPAAVCSGQGGQARYTSASVIGSGEGGFPGGWLNDGDGFGFAIGRVTDVNADDGDNRADFVVGAPNDDEVGTDAGAVYVLRMTAQLRTVDSAFKITEGLRGFTGDLDRRDFFGYSADGVGDVDGNGVPDIAVGAPGDDAFGADNVGFHTGAAFVMLMDANVRVKATVKITAGQGGLACALDAYGAFGSGLAGVGDLDNNGVPDIAVGAYYDGTGASAAGAVYVLLMLPTGHVSSSTKIANAVGGLSLSLPPFGLFGSRVAALGDVNGDGVPDIAVGAPATNSEGHEDVGSVYVLHLTPSGTVGHARQIASHASGFDHSLAGYEYFGSPSRVGDVDGDGIDDLAVGAYGTDSVYVLLMDGNGLVRAHHKISGVVTGRSSEEFGRSVAPVGRGRTLLVGDPSSGAGKVYVLEPDAFAIEKVVVAACAGVGAAAVVVLVVWWLRKRLGCCAKASDQEKYAELVVIDQQQAGGPAGGKALSHVPKGKENPGSGAHSPPPVFLPCAAVPSRMFDNVEQELGVIPTTSWVSSTTRPSRSCLDDLKTNPHIRAAVFNVDVLVSDVAKKVLELRFTLEGTRLAGLLDENELTALAAYTHDNFDEQHRRSNLYFQLNTQLRHRTPGQRLVLKQVWGTFMYYAMSGLGKLPNWRGTLFRGMSHKQRILQQYRKGRPIMWGAFSSASVDFNVAKQFAQPDGVVLRLEVCNARDIQLLSFFPAEGEVLLSPNLTLVVSGEPFQRDGCTVVPLVEMQGSTFVS